MSKLLDDDLMGLSDEERAALVEDEGDDEANRALLKSLLNDDDDDLDDGDGDDDGDEGPLSGRKGASEDGQAEARADAGSAGDQDQGQEAADRAQAEFQPVYVAHPVENYAERMGVLSQQQRDLAKGYEDGDFDLAEYQTRLRALTEQEWALREQQLKASLAQEQRAQQMAQRWQWEQERFFGQAANKAYREDPVIGPAFAAAVQLLASDAKNDQRPMAWFLEEADRLTRARFRVSDEAAAAKGAGGHGQAGVNGKERTRAGGNGARVPPSLGGLPAASLPETGADEFSRLDRLEGLELERALSKLNEAEIDRYLRARA